MFWFGYKDTEERRGLHCRLSMFFSGKLGHFGIRVLHILEEATLRVFHILEEAPLPSPNAVCVTCFLVFLYSNFIPKPHFYSIGKSWLNLQTRGSGWRGRWEGGSGWGTHVNPWLFHSNV